MKHVLDAALEYAQRGWHIIPCNEKDREWKGKLFEAKSPRISNWQKLGTTDAKQIRDWWRKWPDSIIGCLTGDPLGEFVLDIDLPDGPTNLAVLESKYEKLPATKTQRTGSGGQQLFFLMPAGVKIRNSASGIAKNLDIRATGGQVILPPSPHPSGGTYQWMNDLPAAQPPQWLIDLITKPKSETRPNAGSTTLQKHTGGTTEYGRKALVEECSKVSMTLEGGRNDALNRAAFTLGQLVAGGEINRSECEAALLDAAARCALSESEARKTINSGLTKGLEQPRSASPKNHQQSNQGVLSGDVREDQAIPPMDKSQPKPERPDGIPEGFSLRKNGICYAKYDKDGNIEDWIWICSELHVRAITYDDTDHEWGRLLEFKDPKGKTHQWSMPMGMTKGSGESYREILLSMGLLISTGIAQRKKLDEYLTLAKPKKYARCVTRLGWYHNCFVLPDEVIGHNDEQVVFQHSGIKHNFNTAGTLEEWQENVGKYCVGNSRLAFVGSAALVGPLLRLTGEEGGGVHFYGGSSVGKTTAMEVAGSFVGGGLDGFLQSWRLTDNGLEGTAVIHNDSVLMLDEVSQVSSRVCSEVAYMLANGCGKTRAKRDGSLRPPMTWRLMFLSNGEQTFMDKITEDTGRRIKAGQAVRVLDVPADAGKGLRLFEELHEFEDGNQFSKWLKENSKKYYGTPYRAFVRHLVENKDDVAARTREIRDTFIEGLCTAHADGQVRRVAGRFGVIAAAGEEAIRAEILPWPSGEAKKAASICFYAWLDQRGYEGPQEIHDGVEQALNFIDVHGSSRFENLNTKEEQRVVNRAGWKEKKDDGIHYYVIPKIFRDEVCRGFNSEAIADELIERGILICKGTRRTVQKKTRGINKRMYHFVFTGLDTGSDKACT